MPGSYYNVFPVTSCENSFFKNSHEYARYCGKKIKTISPSEIANSLYNASCYAVKQLLKLIKNIIEIFSIAISDLIINFISVPLLPALPSANSFFSKRLIDTVHATLTVPTVQITKFLTKCIPAWNVTFAYGAKSTANLSNFFAVGISEEFVFRGIIQQGLLQKLPKSVLKKFAPGHVNSVDHVISRIARVIFTSFLFAVAHAAAFGNSPGLLLPQFISGILFSTLIERKISFTKVALIHAVFDIAIICILGGL